MNPSIKKNLPYIFMVLVIFAAAAHAIYSHLLVRYFDPTFAYRDNKEAFPRVAKIGRVQGSNVYITSIAGLEKQYQSGFRQFIVNINKTSDHQWVCMGDWQRTTKDIFPNYNKDTPMPYADFRQFPTRDNSRPCDYNEVFQWMDQRQDASLVILAEGNFEETLHFIKTNADRLKERIALLVNNENHNQMAKSLGFDNIYMPLASFSGWKDDYEAYKRITSLTPKGVVMPSKVVLDRTELINKLWENKIPVIANPVNDCETLKTMVKHGASGIYTDILTPDTCT